MGVASSLGIACVVSNPVHRLVFTTHEYRPIKTKESIKSTNAEETNMSFKKDEDEET